MNEKITIQDLANVLANKHGMEKKDAELFIKGVFELVEEALAIEKYVKVKGLGIFKLTDVESRESINVNTGERIEIQGHTKISFTPDNSIKELINKPFSHFETVILNDGVELEETNEELQAPTIIESTGTTDLKEEEVEESTIEIPKNTDEAIETKNDEEIIEEEVVTEAIDAQEYLVEELSSDTSKETSEEILEGPKNDEKDEIDIVESIDEPIEQYSPNNEETLSEESVNEQKETLQEEEEKTNKSLIFITILLILIILGGAYWLFGASETNEESTIIETSELSIENTDSIIDNTSPLSEKVETISDIQEVKLNKNDNEAPMIYNEKVASIGDTLDYKIVGTKTTHILQSGETIIKVALKYYGAKNYWPYIAKHNEKIIKNANNVSKGTKLLIPELAPKK